MTESEFNERAETALRALELAIDAVDAGIDYTRSGSVLTLELDNDTKIIVNTQLPTRQIWVAARSGGYHFAFDGQAWRDTREGTELFTALSSLVSAQGDRAVVLRAP
ncbi:MAG TPA: iron donor protein CyaY [Burkholderiaceae bacterium]|jgi:CyaY protein|nr:iron donor protein CyaY [Burkholderiaceae bacterium]